MNLVAFLQITKVSILFYFFHYKEKRQRKTEAKRQCMKTGRFPVKYSPVKQVEKYNHVLVRLFPMDFLF